jgi:hypothetical protein
MQISLLLYTASYSTRISNQNFDLPISWETGKTGNGVQLNLRKQHSDLFPGSRLRHKSRALIGKLQRGYQLAVQVTFQTSRILR